MACFVVLATVWIYWVKSVAATSLPIHCEEVTCPEGSICAVRAQAPCTDRFCPPPVGSCEQVSTKPGVCPYRLENRACRSLRGVPMCHTDADCNDEMKCCEGCCKTPDAKVPAGDKAPHVKPGMCPVEKELKSLRLWTALYCPETEVVDWCLADDECDGLHKCCTTLCGNQCKRALSVLPPI